MLNNNPESIEIIKEWLDGISYNSINDYISRIIGQQKCLYPEFKNFMNYIDRLNPYYAFIFSIFRLGLPAETIYFQKYLPIEVFKAFESTGLLVNLKDYWEMPQLCILPLNSLYFVTGLPESYPSVARFNQFRPAKDDTLLLINEQKITDRQNKEKYLEVYSDYGLIAINAALKGYNNITIHPKNKTFIPLIDFNITLNGLRDDIFTIAPSSLSQLTSKYDIITGLLPFISDSFDFKSISIEILEDESEADKVFIQINNLLNQGGSISIIIESVGNLHEIYFNKKIDSSLKISSIVLSKVPYYAFAQEYIKKRQTNWEKKFDSIPPLHNEAMELINPKNVQISEMKYVFKQQLKSHNQLNENFLLYPLYNPKYSDLLFIYSNLLI